METLTYEDAFVYKDNHPKYEYVDDINKFFKENQIPSTNYSLVLIKEIVGENIVEAPAIAWLKGSSLIFSFLIKGMDKLVFDYSESEFNTGIISVDLVGDIYEEFDDFFLKSSYSRKFEDLLPEYIMDEGKFRTNITSLQNNVSCIQMTEASAKSLNKLINNII